MEIKNKRILVIAAHPDDEVYGMGGTIAKLSKNNNEVFVFIITEGCSTQYKGNKDIIDIKRKEAINANKILGVKKVIFGDLPDMKLDTISHVELNSVIEKVINEIKPEIVFTHFEGDVNKDHKLVYESTLVATRPTKNQCVKVVISYSVPSSTEWGSIEFSPNMFIEIEEVKKLKSEAIQEYKSELRDYPHPRNVEVNNIYDNFNGKTVGLLNSEKFICKRILI